MTNNKNNDIFENYTVSKAVMTMALPSIMGQLIVLFYSMADTYFLGRTNNPYMVAAVSLVMPVFNICIPIAGLAGIGGGSLISRLLGKKDLEQAQKVGSFCFFFALMSATLFSLFVMMFMRPLLNFLGAGVETFQFARQYILCVLVFGGIPTVLSNTLSNLLRSTGESKKAGFGVTFGGILNMILDPIFMFVIMPKGMEIVGAGVATCISNCCSTFYFLYQIHKLKNETVLGYYKPFDLPTLENIRSIFAVGVPSFITTFLFDLDYIVIGRLMTVYGAIQMAAIGIVLKVERLPLNIGVGICQGMIPLIGYNYAAKNMKRTKKIISFSRMVGLVSGAISVALYLSFAPAIIRFFIDEAQTVSFGTTFLRIRSLATPFMFIAFFTVYCFNGFGKGSVSFFLGVFRWLLINIPMLYILNYFLGMYGVVWSQLISDIIVASTSLLIYSKFMKKVIAQ